MSRRIDWGNIILRALDVGAIILGAVLADRQKPAAPAQPAPTPQPQPRVPEVRIPPRADAEITAQGHTNIDARFRAVPPVAPTLAPPVPRIAPITEPAPASLPGAALHGFGPPDPDATEPDALDAIEPRDLQ